MASERIQRRIEILLDEADEVVAQSDWAVVLDRAPNGLRLDPDNKDALSYLAAAERDLASASSPMPATAQDSPEELEAGHTPEAIRAGLYAGPTHSDLRDMIFGAINGTVTT